MINQLTINGKSSFDDFNVYISTRKISLPTKKIIQESPPYSNMVYDYSDLNGEIYWDWRTLDYEFDIAEFTAAEMEEVKSKLADWLLNVQNTEIYDPYIGDYHYYGSYGSGSWEEDFGAGSLSVSFSVYPYKIANAAKSFVVSDDTYEQAEIEIINNSSHRVKSTITSTGSFNIGMDSTVYSVGSGTHSNFYLDPGTNEMLITGIGSLTFTYTEEKF